MRLIQLTNLFESRIDHIIQARGNKLEAKAQEELPGRDLSAKQVLDMLLKFDPDPRGKNIQWLANQYLAGQFRLEDQHRVHSEMKQFAQVRSKLDKTDLNQYKYHDMAAVVDKEFNNIELGSDEHDDSSIPDVTVLYKGPLGLLAIPKTKEAAQAIGKGTKWCTSAENDNQFHNYDDGPLYVWKDKSGKKFQFHIETSQYMDARDVPIKDVEALVRKNPVLSKLFAEKDKEVLHIDNPDFSLAEYVAKTRPSSGRWPEAEKKILESGNQVQMTKYAAGVKIRWPEAEALMTDPKTSSINAVVSYLNNVIKGRWPEAEKAILASNAEGTILSYMNMIKGRWPEVEPFILKNKKGIIPYAKTRIKGRWPEGEKVLLEGPLNIQFVRLYASQVVRGRWKEAEEKILSTGFMGVTQVLSMFEYIKDVVKGRWPEAEHILVRHEATLINYAEKYYAKRRWPLGEKVLLNTKHDLLHYKSPAEVLMSYVTRVIKGRWPEAEHIIATDNDVNKLYQTKYANITRE